jgi:hypothetical protein
MNARNIADRHFSATYRAFVWLTTEILYRLCVKEVCEVLI